MSYVERLRELGLDASVREFPEGTHTAQDAADAIGCPVAAIVKSLVMQAGGRLELHSPIAGETGGFAASLVFPQP